MLTQEQIITAFQTKLNETPDETQMLIYQEFTQEQLDAVLARNIAIKNDATYTKRLAENFQAYMLASVEEQAAWDFVTPNQ